MGRELYTASFIRVGAVKAGIKKQKKKDIQRKGKSFQAFGSHGKAGREEIVRQTKNRKETDALTAICRHGQKEDTGK